MLNLLRLPPLLRVVSIVGWLFLLAGIGLLTFYLSTGLSASRAFDRVPIIAQNLLWLGFACSFVVIGFRRGVRRFDRGTLLLDSWRSQLLAIALLSALPLCSLAAALFSPPTPPNLVVASTFSLLAALVTLVAVLVGAAGSGPVRPPRAE